MISSSTITSMAKLKLYLHNYPVMLSVLLVSMQIYRHCINKLGIAR